MKSIQGLTLFSVLYDIAVFGGFIYANEYAITGLLTGFTWWFWFSAGISIAALFTGNVKATCQYTLCKFRYELATNLLLGFMLAYYGHYALASILTLWGIVIAQLSYFTSDSEAV